MAELQKILEKRRMLSDMPSTITSSSASPLKHGTSSAVHPEDLKRELQKTQVERDFLAARIKDLENKAIENARKHADSLLALRKRPQVDKPAPQVDLTEEESDSGYEEEMESSEEGVDREGDVFDGFGFISRAKRSSEGTGHHHGSGHQNDSVSSGGLEFSPFTNGGGRVVNPHSTPECTPPSKDVSQVQSRGLVNSAVDWLLAFSGEKPQPREAKQKLSEKLAAAKGVERANKPKAKVDRKLSFERTSPSPPMSAQTSSEDDSVIRELKNVIEMERKETDKWREQLRNSEDKNVSLQSEIEDMKVKLRSSVSTLAGHDSLKQSQEKTRHDAVKFLQAPLPFDVRLRMKSSGELAEAGFRASLSASEGGGLGFSLSERDAKEKYRDVSAVLETYFVVVASAMVELHDARSTVQSQDETIRSLNDVVSEMRKTVHGLEEDLEAKDKEHAELSSALQEAKAALHTAQQQNSSDVQNLKDELRQVQEKFEQAKASNDQLSEELAQTHAKTEAKSQDVQRLKGNLKTAREALDKARTAQVESEQEAKQERVRSEALASQVDSQASALRELNSKLGSFEEALLQAQRFRNASDEIEAELKRTKEDVAAITAKFSDSKKHVSALESKLATVKKAAKTEVEQAVKNAKLTADSAVRAAQAKTAELEEALKSARFKMGTAEGKLQKSKNQVAELSKELKQAQSELKSASVKSEAATKRARTLMLFLFLAVVFAGGSLALPYLFVR